MKISELRRRLAEMPDDYDVEISFYSSGSTFLVPLASERLTVDHKRRSLVVDAEDN